MNGSQDSRDIVSGFPLQIVGRSNFPEVVCVEPIDGSQYPSFSGIIGGHGQIPIVKHVVKVFQIAGSRPARFLRVSPFINPPVDA